MLANNDDALQEVLRMAWDTRKTHQRAANDDDEAAAKTQSLRTDRLRDSLAAGHITAGMEEAIVRGTLNLELPFAKATSAWLKQTERSILLLCGSVGAGKTVAACWAIAECGGGRFITAHELLRVFGGRYGVTLQQQAEIRNAHLLVIDDAWREAEAERKMLTEALLEVMSARLNGNCRRTIVTTNANRQQFLDAYKDDRLHSRFSQDAVLVDFEGKDLRRC